MLRSRWALGTTSMIIYLKVNRHSCLSPSRALPPSPSPPRMVTTISFSCALEDGLSTGSTGAVFRRGDDRPRPSPRERRSLAAPCCPWTARAMTSENDDARRRLVRFSAGGAIPRGDFLVDGSPIPVLLSLSLFPLPVVLSPVSSALFRLFSCALKNAIYTHHAL